MSRDNDLPFQRGTTYYEGDTAAIAADSSGPTNLMGKTFKDYDAATGQEVTLIVLKNGGSALTTPAGKGVAPLAAYIDRAVSGFVASAGGYGYIADPQLTGDVVAGDYFYAILEGFCRDAVLGASNAVDFGVCVFNNAGQLIPVSTNDGYVVGKFAEAVTSTGAGNERVDLIVDRRAADYND